MLVSTTFFFLLFAKGKMFFFSKEHFFFIFLHLCDMKIKKEKENTLKTFINDNYYNLRFVLNFSDFAFCFLSILRYFKFKRLKNKCT